MDSGQWRNRLGLPGLEITGVSARPFAIVLMPLHPSAFWFLHRREKGRRELALGDQGHACGPTPRYPISVGPRWATLLLTISCPRLPASELPGSQEKQCREYGIIGGLLQPCEWVLPILSLACLGPLFPSQTTQTSAICGKQEP